MKYVALCSYFLWPYATGGERTVVDILAGLQRAGHDVLLRYAIPRGLPEHAFQTFCSVLQRFELPLDECSRQRVSYLAGEVPVEALAVMTSPPAWIGDWLEEVAPDVVIVQAKDVMLLPSLAAIWRGSGIVLLQETDALQRLATMLTPGALSRIRHSSLAMAASSLFLQGVAAAAGFESRVLYSALVLPPGGDAVCADAPITAFGTGHDKGVDAVLTLAARLRGSRFRVVIGWNDLVPKERPPNLEFSPFRLNSSCYHQSSSLVLVPSRCQEGFGRVAHEAMAAGRVPVVSDRGALPEVAGSEGVVLPVPDTADELARWESAIHGLADVQGLRSRMHGCRRRAEHLTEESRRQFADLFGAAYS
ncbi:glycosyltransferase family 4 protein [Candidatus Fermentibacteria bacterium]|nr:glycosyltransferase family 4 protein [Candidatus Fermentibacteria bacterium]